jgi:hypothetical protein
MSSWNIVNPVDIRIIFPYYSSRFMVIIEVVIVVCQIQSEVSYPSILHVPSSCMSSDLLASLQFHQLSNATIAAATTAAATAATTPSIVEDDSGSSSSSDSDESDIDPQATTSANKPVNKRKGRPLLSYKLQVNRTRAIHPSAIQTLTTTL